MEKFQSILEGIDNVVWGPITLLLLVGTGIFLTVKLRFVPWKMLPSSLKAIVSPESRKTNGKKVKSLHSRL